MKKFVKRLIGIVFTLFGVGIMYYYLISQPFTSDFMYVVNNDVGLGRVLKLLILEFPAFLFTSAIAFVLGMIFMLIGADILGLFGG